MSRLIDADVLKNAHNMSDECDKCETKWKECQYDYIYSKMDFCTWIDDAPTVEPEPHWIPVTERLPEKEGWYFATVHPDYIVPDSRHTDSLYWLDGKWWFYDYDARMAVWIDPIIAWMPLPEPYTEKGEE